jgi:hypothetical protein
MALRLVDQTQKRQKEQALRTAKRKLQRWVGLRKTSAYYVSLVCLSMLCFLFGALALSGYGLAHVSLALTHAAHLSPVLVIHSEAGTQHEHTFLGNLAFGDDFGYMRCFNQEVIDGVLHVDGKHASNVRLYGSNYIHATEGGSRC